MFVTPLALTFAAVALGAAYALNFYFYSGTYSGEVLDALSAIISSINHDLR